MYQHLLLVCNTYVAQHTRFELMISTRFECCNKVNYVIYFNLNQHISGNVSISTQTFYKAYKILGVTTTARQNKTT